MNQSVRESAATWRSVASRMVGVFDLKKGLAVHGISGNREKYQPVSLAHSRPGSTPGNPEDLFAHYFDLGLRQFYLADLDSLCGGSIQKDCIDTLVRHSGREVSWIIDAGLSDPSSRQFIQWVAELTDLTQSRVSWVIASESAEDVTTAPAFAQKLGASRVVLGIDFRQGQFVGPSLDRPNNVISSHSDRQSPVDAWIRNASIAGIRSVLILDVASVGTSRGPTTLSLCGQFRSQHPDWRIISGGGCRNPTDVQAFLSSGCNDCMVATALHC